METSINNDRINIMQSHLSTLIQESWIITSILMDANSPAS